MMILTSFRVLQRFQRSHRWCYQKWMITIIYNNKKKSILPIKTILAGSLLAVLLTVTLASPALAAGTTVQRIISPSLSGDACLDQPCLSPVIASANFEGKIKTKPDGKQTLSQLSGTYTVDLAEYKLKIKPIGALNAFTFTGDCGTGYTNIQIGDVKLSKKGEKGIRGITFILWSQYTVTPAPSCGEVSFANTFLQITTLDKFGGFTNSNLFASAVPTIFSASSGEDDD